MGAKITSLIDSGNQGILVDIECHISKGLPAIVIVGFANKAIDEAKERLRGAFTNSDLELPRKRITINLAPADIPKDGSSFDLAIATSILVASKQTKETPNANNLFIGELGLDGSVRPVRGIIGKLLSARTKGINTFFIPLGNIAQATLVPDITLYAIGNLRDVYLHFNHTIKIEPIHTNKGRHFKENPTPVHQNDFKNIVGQARAKRALEIAAAGFHNVLLNGPPGTGKSMLAKALPSILPPLSREEILEITQLHSLVTKEYDTIIKNRPFRSPHHSASDVAIIGGGQHPKPGEISLSHRGILFLDELPEFNRSAIEALRQPLEDREVTVTRARESLSFPAHFILIATSNPCPCGYYGTSKTCECPPYQIVKYQRKISGPILDRIDMYVDVEDVVHNKLLTDNDEESSQTISKRVLKARQKQTNRYHNTDITNSDMNNQTIKKFSLITNPARELLNQAGTKLQLSARNYMRAIKVARTIADLEDSETIEIAHISESLQYRRIATDL